MSACEEKSIAGCVGRTALARLRKEVLVECAPVGIRRANDGLLSSEKEKTRVKSSTYWRSSSTPLLAGRSSCLLTAVLPC